MNDYGYLIKIIGDKINGLFSQIRSPDVLNVYYSGASPKNHLYNKSIILYKTSSLLRLPFLEVYKQLYIGMYSLIREVSMFSDVNRT